MKIWQEIELTGKFGDWYLDIVGTGPDEIYYKVLAQKLKLNNITFYGRNPPADYYKRSAIFMMTSEYEGWGLTLLESQQYGCVPMAFSSFAAVKEIIIPQFNGELIEYPDIGNYVEKLQYLMENENYRFQLGMSALQHAAKFSIDKVVAMWNTYFSQSKNSAR